MHQHEWVLKYQISHMSYNFNTYFCSCDMKKVEREAFDRIEETKFSPISDENRRLAEETEEMIKG